MRKNIKSRSITAAPKLTFDPAKKQLLHLGNNPACFEPLPKQFAQGSWQEIRMGLSKAAQPDIIGSLAKLSAVSAKQFHAVWMPSGVLEPLYSHEVPAALQEIHRVLHDNGLVFLTVVDIQKIAEYVAKGNLEAPLYNPGTGPVAAIDLLYGYRPALQAGNLAVNPNTAFTAKTLAQKLQDAGFRSIKITRDGALLWAIAYKLPQTKDGTSLIEIIEPDINKMMRLRDELDKQPEIWTAPSPLFPV